MRLISGSANPATSSSADADVAAVGSQLAKHSDVSKSVVQTWPVAHEPRAAPPSVGSPVQTLPMPALSSVTVPSTHAPLPDVPVVPLLLLALDELLEVVWRPVEPVLELEDVVGGSAQKPPRPAYPEQHCAFGPWLPPTKVESATHALPVVPLELELLDALELEECELLDELELELLELELLDELELEELELDECELEPLELEDDECDEDELWLDDPVVPDPEVPEPEVEELTCSPVELEVPFTCSPVEPDDEWVATPPVEPPVIPPVKVPVVVT